MGVEFRNYATHASCDTQVLSLLSRASRFESYLRNLFTRTILSRVSILLRRSAVHAQTWTVNFSTSRTCIRSPPKRSQTLFPLFLRQRRNIAPADQARKPQKSRFANESESTKMRLPPPSPLSSEDGITKMGSKVVRRRCGISSRVEIRWTRTEESRGEERRRATEGGGEEYECRELSILRISLVDRAFEFRAVAKGEKALQRPIAAITVVGEVKRDTRGEKGTA